jgi:hypothetical protein
MTTVLLAAAILAGRAMSLAVYQTTWNNAKDRTFLFGSPLATFLARMRWWPLHALWVFAGTHTGWDALPAIHPWAVAACALLAFSAAGRLGAADLGRFFIADRLLVLALAAGVVLSPVFIYPCLIAACCLQYAGSGWALSPGYSNLLGFEFIRGSVCVLAAWLVGDGVAAAAGFHLPQADTIAVAAVLGYQASCYAHHAIAKSALGPHGFSWILENRAQYLPVNAHLRGWCPQSSPRRLLLAAASFIGLHRVPVCAAVWLIEAGWLLVLIGPRLAGLLLGLTLVFHTAVFLLTGLFAWQFVVSHLVMLVWVLPAASALGVFAPWNAVAAAACALLAMLWVGGVRRSILRDCRASGRLGRMAAFTDAADLLMAWWDGPYMRMYSWQGETHDGRRVSIPVTALSPYDTILTDIHTHLMILGMHNALDPQIARDRQTVRAGVWGILADRTDRDFIHHLADAADPEPPAICAAEATQPWAYGPQETAPPQIDALRALFLGINARVSNKWFRLVMQWPHFPGEDWVPDRCPLAGEPPPHHRFDTPLKSVSLVRVRVFQHHTGTRLLENAVVGTLRLE